MEIKELVEKYNITRQCGGILRIAAVEKVKADGALDEIKAKKPRILEYFKAQEQERADRERKIASIPGMDEITALSNEWAKYNSAVLRGIETGIGVIPARPTKTVKELRSEYPEADAYLRAKDLAAKYNDELSTIGETAVEKIVNGEWEEAVRYMDEAENSFTEKHIFD